MRRKILSELLVLTVIFDFTVTSCADDGGEYGYMGNKVTFTIGEAKLTATLKATGS